MNVNPERLAEAIVLNLKRSLAPLRQEIAELRAAIEAKQLPKYAGVHSPGTKYAACSLVTKAGALWLSTAETDETPGSGVTKWRLIVKRGDA